LCRAIKQYEAVLEPEDGEDQELASLASADSSDWRLHHQDMLDTDPSITDVDELELEPWVTDTSDSSTNDRQEGQTQGMAHKMQAEINALRVEYQKKKQEYEDETNDLWQKHQQLESLKVKCLREAVAVEEQRAEYRDKLQQLRKLNEERAMQLLEGQIEANDAEQSPTHRNNPNSRQHGSFIEDGSSHLDDLNSEGTLRAEVRCRCFSCWGHELRYVRLQGHKTEGQVTGVATELQERSRPDRNPDALQHSAAQNPKNSGCIVM